ncbi:MAG: hypothetical protein Q9O74_05275 [Planctomycetota bacterium]|nr:hypothetical protein [Planctomycetota bacterium]
MNARAAAVSKPVEVGASQGATSESLRLMPAGSEDGAGSAVVPSGAVRLRGAEAVRVGLRERFAARNPYWVGEKALHAVESDPRAVKTDRAHTQNPHYQLGLSLAPAYIAFARHIVEHAEAFDRVYFLSREGWMFMRMYHRIAAALGVRSKKPRGTYLAVNRRLSFLASMDGLTQPEIARIWAQYPGQSLRRLLRNLCLPEDIFFHLAARHGLTDPDKPIRRPREHAEFGAFVRDEHVQRAFELHRDELRGLLTGYLEQRGFFEADRVALVDIGWKGSIQTNLHRAVRGREDCPEMHGMYFGLDHKPGMDAPGSTKHGFYCDTRVGDWLSECLLTHNSVFEMFATAPHGTVGGYSRDRRGWVHAEARAEAEESRNFRGRFREVWQGIGDYLSDYLHTPGALEVSAAELRPAVLDRVRRYVLYPTAAEARSYLEYSHVESFGVFQVSKYHFKGSWKWILRTRPYREAPARLVQTLRAQRWPAGGLKRSRVPLASWVFDLVETRRRAR